MVAIAAPIMCTLHHSAENMPTRLSREFAHIEAKALEGFSDSDAGLLQELLGRVYENMTEIQKEGTTHK